MALNANALTSIANVRQFLQKQTQDTAQDEIIEAEINRASATIIKEAGREFAPSASATRSFAYSGIGFLDLSPYDLQSVTSITMDTQPGSSGSLITTTDYRLRPLPTPDGVYNRITLPKRNATDTEVTIVGTWGFPSVPADVEHAAIVTVATWLRRDVQAFSTTFNLDETRLERPEVLPSQVRRIIANYQQVSVA